jgi:hypothetical protein
MATLIRPCAYDGGPVAGGSYWFDRGAHRPRFHQGVDLPLSTGTPLYGCGDGTVIGVVKGSTGGGYYVTCLYLVGGARIQVITMHMSRIDVELGQTVTTSTQLGLSGGKYGAVGSGDSTGSHLHLQVVVNGNLTNPDHILTDRSAPAGETITPPPGDDTMSQQDIDAITAHIDAAVVARDKQLLAGYGQHRVFQCDPTVGKAESGQIVAAAPGVWMPFPSFDYYKLALARNIITDEITHLPWNEFTFWRDVLYLASEVNDNKTLAAVNALPAATVQALIGKLSK